MSSDRLMDHMKRLDSALADEMDSARRIRNAVGHPMTKDEETAFEAGFRRAWLDVAVNYRMHNGGPGQ